jgi:hypothetical protein
MTPRRLFTFLALAAALGSGPLQAADNELTADEKKAGWMLLFDGKTLEGWRAYGNRPLGGWEVADGTLRSIARVQGSAARGVEIITEKKFRDFELSWEWKIAHAGNNGVKYFVTEARPRSPGHEYQMLDDDNHPDGRIGPHRQTGAFYDVLPPAAEKPLRKPGEWNHSRIIVKGQTVEHWLNGKNVLTYELGSATVKAGLATSKFRSDEGFGDKIEGHIMLTYHQDDCWFRNLKLRELP